MLERRRIPGFLKKCGAPDWQLCCRPAAWGAAVPAPAEPGAPHVGQSWARGAARCEEPEKGPGSEVARGMGGGTMTTESQPCPLLKRLSELLTLWMTYCCVTVTEGVT